MGKQKLVGEKKREWTFFFSLSRSHAATRGEEIGEEEEKKQSSSSSSSLSFFPRCYKNFADKSPLPPPPPPSLEEGEERRRRRKKTSHSRNRIIFSDAHACRASVVPTLCPPMGSRRPRAHRWNDPVPVYSFFWTPTQAD